MYATPGRGSPSGVSAGAGTTSKAWPRRRASASASCRTATTAAATLIDTAHSLGLKVAAHAHGKDAIDSAIRLGVDSIEHGAYGDAESFRLYKQHGTYLVPTVLVGRLVAGRHRHRVTRGERLRHRRVDRALDTAVLVDIGVDVILECSAETALGIRQRDSVLGALGPRQ